MAAILYFGDDSSGSTSAHRAGALERLGHTVSTHNPVKAIAGGLAAHWLGPLHYRSGFRLLQKKMQQWLEELSSSLSKPDLIWVNSGEVLGPGCLKILKRLGCPLILYNNDDPTGKRDGRRFDLLLKALPFYDLCVVRREVNIAEYKSRGAKEVLLVRMSYDEIAHRPYEKISDIPPAFRSDLAFIGTWIPNERRDEFLLELMSQGIPVSIWGGRWDKSPRWKALKSAYRGGALKGPAYVAAIQGAKICLGLLSKGNRDLHTRRSVEIPFAGGLLCAERTPEHLEMYREGEEAVFWSDAGECAGICRRLLREEERREAIRLSGMQRVRSLGLGNEEVCKTILDKVFQEVYEPESGRNVMLSKS